jgi:hypothetical protein
MNIGIGVEYYNVSHQFEQAKIVLWWFHFKLKPIFAYSQAASEFDNRYKTNQK